MSVVTSLQHLIGRTQLFTRSPIIILSSITNIKTNHIYEKLEDQCVLLTDTRRLYNVYVKTS